MSEDHRAEPAPVPDDVVRELVEHYAAGETLEGLVARYPYSYRKIRTALLDAGVTLRPPRIPLPPTPPGLVDAYRDGRSIRQLATAYGMSYNQTRNLLLAEGVELRRRGQP
ncbi:helix-turn-helix domain-containing protein [Amycolatopsis sp. MEPSY49]|uniref:helix-turn-helix domain-containing protein n=1 Tax=Amycolatopsis sp. MEPSY49 TaxID=3151600 RepID=UPI003EF20EA0